MCKMEKKDDRQGQTGGCIWLANKSRPSLNWYHVCVSWDIDRREVFEVIRQKITGKWFLFVSTCFYILFVFSLFFFVWFFVLVKWFLFSTLFFHVSMAVQCFVFGLFSAAILYEQLQSVMRDETAIEYLIRMKQNRLRRRRTTGTGIGFRKNTTVLQ